MSDPAHPPADGHGHEEKKGPGAKVWAMVGTVLVVLIGGLVLFNITHALAPQVFTPFNNTVRDVADGLSRFGSETTNLVISIRLAVGALFGGWLMLILYGVVFMSSLLIATVVFYKIKALRETAAH